MDVIYVLFLSCPPQSVSSVSALFDFNASLNDVAPVSPILLPVSFMVMKKSGLLIDAICVVSFVLTTQIKASECCV